MVSDAVWEAGYVVENASKLFFSYRDPERPFDTDPVRGIGARWGTQWVKAVAKGWMFFAG